MGESTDQTHRIRLKWSDKAVPPITLPTGFRHKIILVRPQLHRIELGHVLYAPNSILPAGDPPAANSLDEACDALASWSRIAALNPNLRMMAIGHASADGSAGANLELSKKRSAVLVAWLERDHSAWETQIKEELTRSDLACLYRWLADVYGWGAEFQNLATPSDSEFDTACRSFQSGFNTTFQGALDVDGICGPLTRAALLDAISNHVSIVMSEFGVPSTAVKFLPRFPKCGAGSEICTSEHTSPNLIEWANGRLVDLALIDPSELGDCPSAPLQAIYQQIRRELVHTSLKSSNIREVRLFDNNGAPAAGAHCIVVSGAKILQSNAEAGSAGDDGVLRLVVDGNSKVCTLRWCSGVGEHRHVMSERKIFLETDSGIEGLRQKLCNLGFDECRGNERDVRHFQAVFGLEPTGDIQNIADFIERWHDGGESPNFRKCIPALSNEPELSTESSDDDDMSEEMTESSDDDDMSEEIEEE
jgi:hypothetical protein